MSYLYLLFAFITGMVVAFFMRREATRYALKQAKRMGDESSMFKSAFDNAAIGMAIVGQDGRFIRVNDSYCSIVGYTRDEMLARTFQDITHPDDLEMALGYVQKMLDGELKTYQMEERYIRKDGSICHVHLTASATYNKDGSVEVLIAQAQDRNEVVAAREELVQKNRELQETHDIMKRALAAISDETMSKIEARVKAAPYVPQL